MIKHMFKVIWNRKRNNFLLVTEMIFSFGVLFAVVSIMTSSIKRYMEPLGFDYNDIIEFTMYGRDSIDAFEVKGQLVRLPEVARVTFSAIGDPYQESDGTFEMIHKNKRIGIVHFLDVDNDYSEVLNIRISEGRWFNSSDDGSSYVPIVINRKLKNKVFGNESAINKTFEERKKVRKIIGVVENFKKDGEFSEENFVEFNRKNSKPIESNACSFLIKTKGRTNAAFEEKLKKIGNMFSPTSRIIISDMKEQREKVIAPVIKQLILYSTLGAFLIINVALGLFGVLWYNISRRKQEIGIRRALGADKINIYKQITGEILFLTSISIFIGSLLLVQFPLLEVLKIRSGIYYFSLGISAVLIYLLVIICALYPGLMASRIEPAAALHDD